MQANTVEEFSIQVAQEFIRTAVVIDDRIYEDQKIKLNVPEIVQEPKRKKALKESNTPNQNSSDNISGDHDDKEIFSWQQLVTSFAKKKVVCALYQPEKKAKFSETSEVYKLCLASDIVIVDWNLDGSLGKKALELITNLVQNSLEDIPEQLRLILVYTSESNLESIANDVFEALKKELGEDIQPQTEDHGLSMHTSNSRIVILGKPVHVHRLEEYKTHEVLEKDLAERSIKEFSKLASGLLQGTVLLGLAKIRENSRKILSKFDSSLDPAFLTHRALSLPHAEASDQVIPLLMAEFQSVLEDRLPNPILSTALIEDWCSQWEPTSNAKTFVDYEVDIKKFATDFCLKGSGIKKEYTTVKILDSLIDQDNCWNTDDISSYRQITNFLHFDNKQNKNHEFAALMSHRTHYGNIEPALKLGTIVCVKDNAHSQYLLCLQPLCDSVRLSGKKNFIFCKLQSGTNKRTSFVVKENGEFKELFFRPNAANCVVVEFKADKHAKSIVARNSDIENIKWFVSTSDSKYLWLAQLKSDHAQRAAEQFASNLSRVGLTESEWLRLMSK